MTIRDPIGGMMTSDTLLQLLNDRRVLLEAQAASSANVLWRSLQSTASLETFRGHDELSQPLAEAIERLAAEQGDPVVLAAHLYALSLTGTPRDLAAAAGLVREAIHWRADPLVSPIAIQLSNGLPGESSNPPRKGVPA